MKEFGRFYCSLNEVGQIIITWCIISFILLIGGLFSPKMLSAGFASFILGGIPASIGLFFIEYDIKPED